MRGCGKQLVRWQLRALCKPWMCGKKCGKKHRADMEDFSQSDWCRHLKTAADSSHNDHVTSHVTQGPQCTKGNKRHQHSSCHQHHDHSDNRNHGNRYHHGDSRHHHQQHEHYHHHHGNHHYHGHDNKHNHYHGNKHHDHHGNKQQNSSSGQKRDAAQEKDDKTARDATVNDTYWEEVNSIFLIIKKM